MDSPIAGYLREIETARSRQNATGHTNRPALQRLLERLGDGIAAVNEPKRSACGAPDYVGADF